MEPSKLSVSGDDSSPSVWSLPLPRVSLDLLELTRSFGGRLGARESLPMAGDGGGRQRRGGPRDDQLQVNWMVDVWILTWNPKGEFGQCLQLMSPLIVLDKLRNRYQLRPPKRERERRPYAASIAPSQASPVVRTLGWSPPPFVVKLHCVRPIGGVVSDQVDVGVPVEIGVGMKLSRDEVVYFTSVGGGDEGQAVDGRVGRTRAGGLLAPADGDCKDEMKVVFRGKLEKQRCRRAWIGVLGLFIKGVLACSRGRTHLHKLHEAVVAGLLSN